MADRMVEKVARAMFGQDHDEPWAQGEARTKEIYLNNTDAALEACCYEELVETLETLSNELAPWLTTADAGLPAVIKTLGESAELHFFQRKASALLAKVKDEGQ